jgi:putative DNA primase/helicase
MIRQSSSESGAMTFKGTVGGKATRFHVRSMFCLASIQVGIKQQADFERIARLTMRKPGGPGDADAWDVLQEELHKIERDPTIGARLLRRTFDLLPTTLKNIEVFAKAAAAHFGNQRDGDQYGVLVSGAWSLISSKPATYAEAEAMIKAYDWDEHVEASQVDEPTRMLFALMGAKIRHQVTDVTVHELVRAAAGLATEGLTISKKEAAAILGRNGMKVLVPRGKPLREGELLFQSGSEELPKLLAHTSFQAGWWEQLKRAGADAHVDADGEDTPAWFSGVGTRRCRSLPLALVLGDEFEEATDGREEETDTPPL